MYRIVPRSRPPAAGGRPGAGGAPRRIRGESGRKGPGEIAACCPGSRRRDRWWAQGPFRDPGQVPERRGRTRSGRGPRRGSRRVPGRQPGRVREPIDGGLVRPAERRGRNLPRPSGLPEPSREGPPGRSPDLRKAPCRTRREELEPADRGRRSPAAVRESGSPPCGIGRRLSGRREGRRGILRRVSRDPGADPGRTGCALRAGSAEDEEQQPLPPRVQAEPLEGEAVLAGDPS